MRTTKQDKADFALYLTQCTDRQVQGVYDTEKQGGRRGNAQLAREEAARRGITLTEPGRRTYENTRAHLA